MVGDSGIEPLTSSVSTKRSTSELTALIYIQLYKIFATCQEFSLNSKVVNFVSSTILTVFNSFHQNKSPRQKQGLKIYTPNINTILFFAYICFKFNSKFFKATFWRNFTEVNFLKCRIYVSS